MASQLVCSALAVADLPPLDRLILVYLANGAGEMSECPSASAISAALSISVRRVREGLGTLEGLGHISRVARLGRTPFLRVHPDGDPDRSRIRAVEEEPRLMAAARDVLEQAMMAVSERLALQPLEPALPLQTPAPDAPPPAPHAPPPAPHAAPAASPPLSPPLPSPAPHPSPPLKPPPSETPSVVRGRGGVGGNRGSRMSLDWQPERITGGVALRNCRYLGVQRVSEELDRFRDYWMSKPGRGGLAADWNARWRMWISKAAAWERQRNGD